MVLPDLNMDLPNRGTPQPVAQAEAWDGTVDLGMSEHDFVRVAKGLPVYGKPHVANHEPFVMRELTYKIFSLATTGELPK